MKNINAPIEFMYKIMYNLGISTNSTYMHYKSISASEGRKNLATLIRQVDESGDIVVFTIHGKAKVAMIDIDLLDEFIENMEFGLSSNEIKNRSKEKTISFEQVKKQFNV